MITEVRERIAQSLHNAVWLTLGMERQDYHIERPFSATLMQASRPAVALSPETRIAEVFNSSDVARQLLILGEPGSGKTTMMLELAKDLLERAIEDKAEPIPVLVNLSSWKDPKQPIFDWLVGELNVKYGIRKDLAQQWIQESQLLPLLDALDEVAPEHQRACATALNTWLIGDSEQRPCGVLICCRREEFEQVVQKLLSLYGAVYLQALNPEQIENYFVQFGLQDVWQTVQQDEALQELLTKPLFLSIFGLVQSQKMFSLKDWQSRTTSADKVEYLLDTYWEAAITRDLIIDPNQKLQGISSKTYGIEPCPDRETVHRALVFAAKALERESQTELSIDRMQPSWLPEKWQKEGYKSLFMLFLMSVWLIANFLSRQFSEWLPLLLTTFPSLNYFLTSDCIEPTEKLQFNENTRSFIRENFWTVCIAFKITTLVIGGIIWLAAKVDERLSYFPAVVLTGVLINFFVVWLIKNMRTEAEVQIATNQGIKNSWSNMIFFTITVLVLVCTFGMVYQLRINLFAHLEFPPRLFFTFVIYAIGFGLLEGGGKALLQHLSLRLVLAWNRYAPFRYDLLLNYCTERLLLQRIGGRYRFMHKTLQDYFAKMDLSN